MKNNINNKFKIIVTAVNNRSASDAIIDLQDTKLILKSQNSWKLDYIRSSKWSASDTVTETNIIIISTLVSYA